LIKHADIAQQAFSAEAAPSLHNALPAVEALYAAWNKRSTKNKYKPFEAALDAGAKKLNEYYTKTAESDAHILAMGGSWPFLAGTFDQLRIFSSTS
jgi:hypothetical protein